MSKIAVFDSGLGGLTVLSELTDLMPKEDYIYFGDSAHAPFGDRPDRELLGLCTEICAKLLSLGPVDCFAVACNTTTTRVLGSLRQRFPNETFIGISPALKEAVRDNSGKNILVLATSATAKSRFLLSEAEKYASDANIAILAAPGIVPFVEGDGTDRESFKKYLRELLSEFSETTDAVVLGCTHFPFVRDELGQCFSRKVRFYDGAGELAKKVRGLIGPRETAGEGSIIFLNSDPDKVKKEEKLFYEYKYRRNKKNN